MGPCTCANSHDELALPGTDSQAGPSHRHGTPKQIRRWRSKTAPPILRGGLRGPKCVSRWFNSADNIRFLLLSRGASMSRAQAEINLPFRPELPELRPCADALGSITTEALPNKSEPKHPQTQSHKQPMNRKVAACVSAVCVVKSSSSAFSDVLVRNVVSWVYVRLCSQRLATPQRGGWGLWLTFPNRHFHPTLRC